MTDTIKRIIATLLVVSLAACSSNPWLSLARPGNAGNAAASPSTTVDRAATEPQPEPIASKPAPERPDTTGDSRSHLTELGKGVVLITLLALLVWLQYHAIYPYPDARR